jgi:SAM-dependent methyltransferase
MPVHQLSDLPDRSAAPKPWDGVKANLPWGDPEFSKRMLKEHMDPSHDQASRRPTLMTAQVSWVATGLLKPRNAKNILDLTCGPGLWANALARRGYMVRGIDISPASIDYARKTARDEGLSATFFQADIRDAVYGSGYDAALFVYGEANTLKWEDFAQVLLKVGEALNPGGILILELKPPEAMASMAGSSWQTRQSGLFGDYPYLWLSEAFWNQDDRTSFHRHYVVDIATTKVKEYGVSYQCYTRDDLESLLPLCGLKLVAEYDSLTGEKGLRDPEWHVVVAERPKVR